MRLVRCAACTLSLPHTLNPNNLSAMALDPRHLEYFKDLLEGRAELSWNAWFAANNTELEQTLPRAEFLHLKFKKTEEAERLLQANGVDFTITPEGRREKRFALFAPEVCDERGRPREEFLRRAYDGAIGEFMDGRHPEAAERVRNFVRKLQRRPIPVREEEFADLCFDGEMEILAGNPALGRILLTPLADLKMFDDRIDPMIFRARALLAHSSTGMGSEPDQKSSNF